ncbi:unnamed protein product [Adineta ricciae]|uniref:Uncharacterized protein n=1 Tax=Adineta ricciae TaxID=249248 RepID=A0A815JBU0_ADIRI|nr:unnamed protein product [Adineta ricciae]
MTSTFVCEVQFRVFFEEIDRKVSEDVLVKISCSKHGSINRSKPYSNRLYHETVLEIFVLSKEVKIFENSQQKVLRMRI